MKAKYINPFTDFGFKKIFGEEASKPLLIDFLNALLPDKNRIVDLSFKDKEKLGRTEAERKAIYDIFCENDKGEKFIVELQKAKQNYFKERTIFYSTFPIREQAERGEWNYDLQAVYCIGILDFRFTDYEKESEREEVYHAIKLKNQHGEVFYDKLTYVYLEMPNFNKTEAELTTRLDQWLYFIKHLEDFQSIPAIFKDAVFAQAFESAEIANYDEAELARYEESVKNYRDWKGQIDTARDEGEMKGRLEGLAEGEAKGKLEGKLEGLVEAAKGLKALGISINDIVKATGLTDEQVKEL